LHLNLFTFKFAVVNTSISISIAEHAFRNNYLRDLHIYYLLRAYSQTRGGWFGEATLKDVAKITNKKLSTVNTRIRNLKKRGWVIKCKGGGFKFKSQAKIYSELDITGKRVAVGISIDQIKDFNEFRSICYSGHIGRIERNKEYKHKKLLRGVRPKRRHENKKGFEIAINYSAKVLNTSYSTSQRIRKQSEKHGYVKVSMNYDKNFEITLDNIEEFKISRKYADVFKPIRIIDQKLRVIDSFSITSNISLYVSNTFKSSINAIAYKSQIDAWSNRHHF